MGYLLVLLKSLSSLCEGVLIRKYSEKHKSGSMFFTGVISFFAMLFFLITDADGFHTDAAILPWALAFGGIYCTAYLLTFVALSCGPFTLSMLVISYSLVFPIAYGIIGLGESVSAFTCIGFVLLALSLFLVRSNKDNSGQKITAKWILAISLTAVGNGMLSIIQKVQQLKFDNRFNHEFMVIALALSAALLLCCGIIRDRADLKEILRFGVPYAAGSGCANGLNNFLGLVLNTLLPLSIISPLNAGVKIVLSFFCSRLLFREHYIPRQIIGVAVGAAALVFLNLQ